MEKLKKRNYIITKCYKLLLKKGFDGVSISDIQSECNVARGLLYHYFGSKEELFYEVVKTIVLPQFSFSCEDVKDLNLRDLLRLLCYRYQNICINDELDGISLLNFDFLIYRAVQENQSVKIQYEKTESDRIDIIKSAIQISILNEKIRNDIDTSKLAFFIASLIDGVWLNSLSTGNTEHLIKQLEEMVSLNLQLLNHK